MTEIPSGTPNETPSATPTEPPKFSWPGFILGLVISIFAGGAGNIITGLMATSQSSHVVGFLIGAIAGVVLILISLALRRGVPALSTGLLCGGCVIGLIGGACGASMVGMSFH